MGKNRRRWALAVGLLVGLGLVAPMQVRAEEGELLHCEAMLTVELGPETETPRTFSGTTSVAFCEHYSQYHSHIGGAAMTISGTISSSSCAGSVDGKLRVDEEGYETTIVAFGIDTAAGAGAAEVTVVDEEDDVRGGGAMAMAETLTGYSCVPPGTGGHDGVDIPGIFTLHPNEGWSGNPDFGTVVVDFKVAFD